jgi:hypothetical protein
VTICIAVFIPINKLTLMALFAAGAGAYFFFRGQHLAARRWSLEHAPASTVIDASLGAVAISGMVTGPYTLTAPLSGKPCFFYQATAWQQTQPRGNQQWHKVAEETLHLPFFLEDTTGRLLVEPFGAELDLRADICQEFGTSLAVSSEDAIPPRISVFLARHGVVSGHPIRIEERTLQPERPIFIAGTLMENPGIRLRPFSPGTDDAINGQTSYGARQTFGDSADSASAVEVIKLDGGEQPSSTSAMTQQQKIAAALTRAGITKPEAWAVTGVSQESVGIEEPPLNAPPDVPFAATSSRAHERSQGETAPDAGDTFPPFVLMKGTDGEIFVISSRSQSELASSFGWMSIAMVSGGAFLAALGSYVLWLEHAFR